MFSYVTKDIPAFVTVSGRPAEPRGINLEGLKRRGFDAGQIRDVREAYRIVYRQGLTLDEAVEALKPLAAGNERVASFVATLRSGTRGLVR